MDKHEKPHNIKTEENEVGKQKVRTNKMIINIFYHII
jgi:hypothetical protein